MKSTCELCDEIEKEDIKKVFLYYRNKKPEFWKLIVVKYDLDGVYRAKLNDILDS